MDTLRDALENRPNRQEDWSVWLEMGSAVVVLAVVAAVLVARRLLTEGGRRC